MTDIRVLERIRMIGILNARAPTGPLENLSPDSAIITITACSGCGGGLRWVCSVTGGTGFIKLKEEAYYMSSAAVKVIWWEVGVICLGTLLVCFLVMMIPSLLVRRIQPVKAIRFR